MGKTCITVDNYSSFCQCIEHLIVVHHLQKIALLAGIAAHPDSEERVPAYRDTMNKYRLPISETVIEHGEFSEYSDYQASRLIDSMLMLVCARLRHVSSSAWFEKAYLNMQHLYEFEKERAN